MDDIELRMNCLHLADKGIGRDRNQVLEDAAAYYAFVTGMQPGMAAFIPEEQGPALFSRRGLADQSTGAVADDVAWKDMR